MLIQYPDVEERKTRLAELVDVENRVWVKVGDGEKVFAIADEDLERANEEKTSAVHFLRFQFDAETATAISAGGSITFGIDHEGYGASDVEVPEATRAALAADLS